MTSPRRHVRFIVLISAVAAMALAGAVGRDQPPPDAIDSPEIARELAVAANRFIDTLDAGMQAKYLFQDAERGNFHFFPVSRRGVPAKQLRRTTAPRPTLASATLSHAGTVRHRQSLGDYLKEGQDAERPSRFGPVSRHHLWHRPQTERGATVLKICRST